MLPVTALMVLASACQPDADSTKFSYGEVEEACLGVIDSIKAFRVGLADGSDSTEAVDSLLAAADQADGWHSGEITELAADMRSASTLDFGSDEFIGSILSYRLHAAGILNSCYETAGDELSETLGTALLSANV